MKSFIVAVVAFAFLNGVAPQGFSDQAKAAITKCSGQFPNAPTSIINEDRLPATDDEKCLMECLFTEVGLVQNGEYSLGGTKALVDARYTDQAKKDEGHRLAESCAAELKNKVDEKCWLGKAVRECRQKNGSNIKLL